MSVISSTRRESSEIGESALLKKIPLSKVSRTKIINNSSTVTNRREILNWCTIGTVYTTFGINKNTHEIFLTVQRYRTCTAHCTSHTSAKGRFLFYFSPIWNGIRGKRW
jgi:hypothetical protein